MSGDFLKSLGKKGKAKVKRILISEYQKYIINCLRTGEKALLFESWLKELGKKPKGE